MITNDEIGLILLLTPPIVAYLAYIAHDAYWLYKCYTQGGDWQYYLKHILAIIAVSMMIAGGTLIIAG